MLQRLGLLLGLVITILVWCLAWGFTPHGKDFAIFYQSSQDWLAGGSGYPPALERYTNLNPPTVTILLMGWWAYGNAVIVGHILLIANIVAWLATVYLMRSELKLTNMQTLAIVALVGCSFPWIGLWIHGQITWIIAFLGTLGWRAWRNQQETRASVWLGLVIALKPFFIPMALLLGWRPTLTAGVVGASLSLLSIAVGGLEPWHAWHRTVSAIDWVPSLTNASLWGWASRFAGGHPWTPMPMSDVYALWPVVLLASLGLLYVTLRTPLRARWLPAGLLAILTAPTGWFFYTIVLVGPMVAFLLAQPRTVKLVTAFVCLLPVPWFGWAALSGTIYPAFLCWLLVRSRSC